MVQQSAVEDWASGKAAVPVAPRQPAQIVPADATRTRLRVVNEGTVDVFVGANPQTLDFRVATGMDETFTFKGPAYAQVPAGSPNEGFVRFYIERT